MVLSAAYSGHHRSDALHRFLYPGRVALAWAGYTYAAESWAINEHSNITAEGPPIYPFKTVIPIAGTILLLQGIVEIVRCIICIRQGTGHRASRTSRKLTSTS